MKFIGIRLDEHDSNISYSDGVNVKYLKSERKHQVKHHCYNNFDHPWFVKDLIDFVGGNFTDIDAIAVVADPEWHVNESFTYDPNKLFEQVNIKLFNELDCPVFRLDHHYAHALSLWTSGKNFDTHIVMDGWGDHERGFSFFKGNNLESFETVRNMESIGRILAELGYRFDMTGHDQDFAGKLMGLKSHGKINQELYDSFSSYTLRNTSDIYATFEKTVDWLCTAHKKFEDLFPKFFGEYLNDTDAFGYTGGVAQNTVINNKLISRFPNIHIPPHCADEGLSLGCVEFLRQYYDQEPFSTDGFPFWQSDEAPDTEPSDETIEKVSEYLAQGKIVGWYQGHGEVGPRALGNRSILMDPSLPDGKDFINKKVKHREHYRPFGASVLQDDVSKYFDWSVPSEYMLFVTNVLSDSFPAITHVDGTCRIQTVSDSNSHYYKLLNSFKQKTGIPMLLNTSLNVGGRPIAGHMRDAVELYDDTELDVLVIGDEIRTKL